MFQQPRRVVFQGICANSLMRKGDRMKPKKVKPRRQHDILWKGSLKGVFEDPLRFVFHRADRIFVLERGFEYLDKELSTMSPGPGRKIERPRLMGKTKTMGIIEQVK